MLKAITTDKEMERVGDLDEARCNAMNAVKYLKGISMIYDNEKRNIIKRSSRKYRSIRRNSLTKESSDSPSFWRSGKAPMTSIRYGVGTSGI